MTKAATPLFQRLVLDRDINMKWETASRFDYARVIISKPRL
jgi:hypothetical protein